MTFKRHFILNKRLYYKMALINQPVTENYIYQTLISILTSNKTILSNGVNPNTEIFLQYKNNNYDALKENGYKYTFVYNFELDDFLIPTAESIKRAEVISHDQMSINFGANLFSFNRYQNFTKKNYILLGGIYEEEPIRKEIYNIATVGSLYNLPDMYSKQYPIEEYENGITLKTYMQTVINELPVIVDNCHDMTNVQEYYPVNYIYEYNYTDLLGQSTKKTATFTAIKYTFNGLKKVLFLGTGLQEFVVV
jgi:hypothetical protein